jgi:hypothetical protein
MTAGIMWVKNTLAGNAIEEETWLSRRKMGAKRLKKRASKQHGRTAWVDILKSCRNFSELRVIGVLGMGARR